jgi:hypothetical protein
MQIISTLPVTDICAHFKVSLDSFFPLYLRLSWFFTPKQYAPLLPPSSSPLSSTAQLRTYIRRRRRRERDIRVARWTLDYCPTNMVLLANISY